MKKKLKALIVLLFLTAILVLPYLVFAQAGTSSTTGSSPLDKLQAVGGGSYKEANQYTLAELLGRIANAFLSLLAIIFIILIILAGYSWLTASGNEQKVEKAKNTIIRAIIGLLIILGAWAIWLFIDNSGLISTSLK